MTEEVVVKSADVLLADASAAKDEAEEGSTEPKLSAQEERAQEDGWVPKDQWKGDPEDWRPAKEFNDRGELFNRIKEQKKEMEQLKGAVSFLTNQNKTQYIQGHKDAIAELKARRDAALQEGDHVQAAHAQDQLDEVKDALKVAQATQVTQPQGPSSDFVSWKEKNSWYMRDEDATMFADAKGLKFRNNNQGSTEKQMLDYVTKEVAKAFPDILPRRSPPSPNGSGGTSPRGSSATEGTSETENEMTDEQRTIMKTIMKSTGMTKAEYIKQFNGRT